MTARGISLSMRSQWMAEISDDPCDACEHLACRDGNPVSAGHTGGGIRYLVQKKKKIKE